MFGGPAHQESGFLPGLTLSIKSIDSAQPINTKEFVDACSKVFPIFDHIGTVFSIAKHELTHKRDSVEAVADQFQTLDQIVAAGKADQSITVKNSPARNVHRLLNTIAFIREIFKGLYNGQGLKEAVSEAYDATLGLLHNWMVRAGIKTGMMGLPSREDFLTSIGETEDSAKGHAQEFIAAADAITAAIEKLYTGVEMPKSDFSVGGLWK